MRLFPRYSKSLNRKQKLVFVKKKKSRWSFSFVRLLTFTFLSWPLPLLLQVLVQPHALSVICVTQRASYFQKMLLPDLVHGMSHTNTILQGSKAPRMETKAGLLLSVVLLVQMRVVQLANSHSQWNSSGSSVKAEICKVLFFLAHVCKSIVNFVLYTKITVANSLIKDCIMIIKESKVKGSKIKGSRNKLWL